MFTLIVASFILSAIALSLLIVVGFSVSEAFSSRHFRGLRFDTQRSSSVSLVRSELFEAAANGPDVADVRLAA